MNKARAFTVAELAIVITVIGVLAVVSLFAFNGTQERTRNSVRQNDAQTITKGIQVYKARNGAYPPNIIGDWQRSNVYSTNFMNDLVVGNALDKVPVDPINNASNHYRYYLYPAGTYGCDASRGAYYVFAIIRVGASPSPNSPGFSCPSRDWATESSVWYVTGAFSR